MYGISSPLRKHRMGNAVWKKEGGEWPCLGRCGGGAVFFEGSCLLRCFWLRLCGDRYALRADRNLADKEFYCLWLSDTGFRGEGRLCGEKRRRCTRCLLAGACALLISPGRYGRLVETEGIASGLCCCALLVHLWLRDLWRYSVVLGEVSFPRLRQQGRGAFP